MLRRAASAARVAGLALLLTFALAAALLVAAATPLAAAPVSPAPPPPVASKPGGALYRPANKYPVLDAIEATRDSLQALRDSAQAAVDRLYEAQAKRDDDQAVSLRVDWRGVRKPAGPEAFPPLFYFPPVAQYMTNTCWSFCATSFFESEVARLTGQQIKLSEMWPVYWEYVERARRFVREYGHSAVAEGSQDHGPRETYALHGAVPAEAYTGLTRPGTLLDHGPLIDEVRGYLDWVKENKLWDEATVVASVRAILDKHMGRPPETFVYGGQTFTPQRFLAEVLRLDLDAYVDCISTMRQPFGPGAIYDVPDNWRRRADYLNLPLDRFYGVIKAALKAGYTVSLGGDVSEPGLDGLEDAAIIPSWDIPSRFIDQQARELRIVNRTSTDDHGVHAVGYLRVGDRDWFLIKDSNRSSRLGRFKGFYFYDGDYVRLKTLSFLVHKDALELPAGK